MKFKGCSMSLTKNIFNNVFSKPYLTKNVLLLNEYILINIKFIKIININLYSF